MSAMLSFELLARETRKSALLVLISIILLFSCTHSPQTNTTTVEVPPDGVCSFESVRIHSLLEREIGDGDCMSISTAVVQEGEMILNFTLGEANRESSIAATNETVYRIASTTKPFTAAAILSLVEQGRLELDTTISQLIPEWTEQSGHITLTQLLNHTSGLPNYTEFGERFLEIRNQVVTHEQMLALFQNEPLHFRPGMGFRYSNSGYYLLGMIIEMITGESYATYIENSIIEPTHVSSIGYCLSPYDDPCQSIGYINEDEEIIRSPEISMSVPFAAGALCGTSRDLALWMDALVHGRVLSEETFHLMTTTEPLPDGTPMAYGFGLSVGWFGTMVRISHPGGIEGFSSQLIHLPEADLSVAVLANVENCPTALIADNIVRELLCIPEIGNTEVILEVEDLRRFDGTYDIGGIPIIVSIDAERLTMAIAGQPAIPLIPLSSHQFSWETDRNVFITFLPIIGTQRQMRGLLIDKDGMTVGARFVDTPD